ncbi:RNA-directed DNA polymerase, eukaryota [Tanacetum coccineum]
MLANKAYKRKRIYNGERKTNPSPITNYHPSTTTTYHHQDDEDNENGWKRVSRREKKVTEQKDITISYFFTNFPNGWNDTLLWKTFAKYRRIIDVYVAKKKTVNGKEFGLARFINMSNPSSLENTLNSITIGNARLKVNIARFQRGHATGNHHPPQIQTNYRPQSAPQPNHTHKTNIHNPQTFQEILTGSVHHTPLATPPTPIIFHSCPDVTSMLEHSLVGELNTIETIPNLHTICEENGFPNIMSVTNKSLHFTI